MWAWPGGGHSGGARRPINLAPLGGGAGAGHFCRGRAAGGRPLCALVAQMLITGHFIPRLAGARPPGRLYGRRADIKMISRGPQVK